MTNEQQPQCRRSSLAVSKLANLEAGPTSCGSAAMLKHDADFRNIEASARISAAEADSVAWNQDDGKQNSDPNSVVVSPEKTLVRRSKMMREAECDMTLSENLEHQVERHLAR